jgi:hypothetical protein
MCARGKTVTSMQSAPLTGDNHGKDVRMDPTEIHAKAAIAAALIASHAVEIPRIPSSGLDWTKDASSIRLRELTDFVYRTIVDNPSGEGGQPAQSVRQ